MEAPFTLRLWVMFLDHITKTADKVCEEIYLIMFIIIEKSQVATSNMGFAVFIGKVMLSCGINYASLSLSLCTEV